MIQINNITKNYANQKVLMGVSFIVPDGSVYGIVGGNGAGKTTLLNILSGAMRGQNGEVKIDGRDVRAINEVPNVIGYVQDEFTAFPYLTAKEYLTYLGDLANLSEKILTSRIDMLAEMFNLKGDLNKRCNMFSKGMKQKLSIAAVLLGNPKVLLMDEPTSNLDADAKEEMKGVIEKLKASGKSIIIATNSFWDVENFCDVVGLMSKGAIKIEKNVQDIIQSEKAGISIKASREDMERIRDFYSSTNAVTTLYPDRIIVSDSEKDFQQVIDEVNKLGYNIYSISVMRETFKDAFLREARKL